MKVANLNEVEMNRYFEHLGSEDDVVTLQDNPDQLFISHPMFKLRDLIKKITCELLSVSSHQDLEKDYYKPRKKWIDEGLDCEILNLGATSWKKGKLRLKVTVEFCPEQAENSYPESPLDDVRQLINENKE